MLRNSQHAIENIMPDHNADKTKLSPSPWFRHEAQVTDAAVAVEVLVGAVALLALKSVSA
jgi:hypothetical protein